MTGSVLLFQPSNMLFSSMGAEAQISRKQIWFSLFPKTESIITFEQNWTTATLAVKKPRLVGTAPGRVGDNSFWLIMFN